MWQVICRYDSFVEAQRPSISEQESDRDRSNVLMKGVQMKEQN